MPKLHQEILEDIFLQITKTRSPYAVIGKNLEKFMLSGKESYDAAINFFGRAKIVHINQLGFDIALEKRCYTFPFDFLFLKQALSVMATSIEKMDIHDYPEKELEFMVFDKLIRQSKSLKKIKFSTHTSSYCTYLLKNVVTADIEVKVGLEMSLSDLSLIRLSEKNDFNMNFDKWIERVPDNFSFPIVQKISNLSDFTTSEMEKWCIKDFAENISKCFPNLTKLSAAFHCDYCDWDSALQFFYKIQQKTFKKLSKNIRGKIEFIAFENHRVMDEVVEYELNDFVYNYHNGEIKKSLKIHDGLTFKACVCFKVASDNSDDGENVDEDSSSSSSDSSNNMDVDD